MGTDATKLTASKAAMKALVDVVRSVHHTTSSQDAHYLESYITYLKYNTVIYIYT